MKKNISYALLITALAVLPLGFTTGCARHHYHSSRVYVNDKTVSARIKSDLLRDRIVHGEDVDVTTYNGEVQLSGFVRTQEEKNRAAQIAASVPGVAAVRNDLIVRTGR